MIAEGGGKWILGAAVVALAVSFLFFPFGVASLGLPVFATVFFRDPDREPDGEGLVAPADGKVTVLREDDGRVRLGVFMNLHNVHVNRAPLEGKIEDVEHREGRHLPAFTKESERNERVVTEMSSDEGEVKVVQIAGALARRITSYVSKGERVSRGERIGVIAFGSRVDILFPQEYSPEDLEIEKGDKVRAGETVIGKRKYE